MYDEMNESTGEMCEKSKRVFATLYFFGIGRYLAVLCPCDVLHRKPRLCVSASDDLKCSRIPTSAVDFLESTRVLSA